MYSSSAVFSPAVSYSPSTPLRSASSSSPSLYSPLPLTPKFVLTPQYHGDLRSRIDSLLSERDRGSAISVDREHIVATIRKQRVNEILMEIQREKESEESKREDYQESISQRFANLSALRSVNREHEMDQEEAAEAARRKAEQANNREYKFAALSPIALDSEDDQVAELIRPVEQLEEWRAQQARELEEQKQRELAEAERSRITKELQLADQRDRILTRERSDQRQLQSEVDSTIHAIDQFLDQSDNMQQEIQPTHQHLPESHFIVRLAARPAFRDLLLSRIPEPIQSRLAPAVDSSGRPSLSALCGAYHTSRSLAMHFRLWLSYSIYKRRFERSKKLAEIKFKAQLFAFWRQQTNRKQALNRDKRINSDIQRDKMDE